MTIKRMGVDHGYNTQVMYGFCRQNPRVLIPVHGQDRQQQPLSRPFKIYSIDKRRSPLYRYDVGVSILKKELYGWLGVDAPALGDREPAGYPHFPVDYEEEYFRSLCSEKQVPIHAPHGGGIVGYQWVKEYDRNEVLDTSIYARAAASHYGIDLFEEKQWVLLERRAGLVVTPARSKSRLSQTAWPADLRFGRIEAIFYPTTLS